MDILIVEYNSVVIYYNDGNQNFTPAYINSNANGTNIIAGDFDSDGIADFITTSYASTIAIKFWKNYGDPNLYFHGFLPASIANVPVEEEDITVDDIDNDGDLDLIMSVASGFWNGSHIKCFLNDGNANFTDHTINYNYPNKGMQVIDFDNDGDKDFVIYKSGGNTPVYLFTNNGNLNFTSTTLTNDEDLGAIHVGDYDNDGDMDIAAVFSPAFPYRNPNFFAIYYNNGNNTFNPAFIDYIDQGEHINSLDYNNDGAIDFLVVSETMDDPVIFENTGNGFTKNILDDTFSSPDSFYTADIDNDGLKDIVSTSRNEHELVLWHNEGNFNFNKIVIDSDEPIISYAYIADINGDGFKDILVTTNAYNMGKILLYTNDGQMNFTKSILFNETDRYRAFATDIDNDGDMDIIYSSMATNGPIRYKRNDGNGVYQTIEIGRIDYGQCVAYQDFDNDGYKDIITNKETYFKNDGNLNFTEISLPAKGTIYDIDNDGDLDILSCRYEPSISNSLLSWFENEGNNNFTEHQIQTGLIVDGHFSIQDFDADGDMDFISIPTSDYNSSKLSCWINNGQQNFTRSIINDNYLDGQHLISADFDSDGDIDILSSSIRFPFTLWKNLNNIPLPQPIPDIDNLTTITAQCEYTLTTNNAPTATDYQDGTIHGVPVINGQIISLPYTIDTQGRTHITWTYTDSDGHQTSQPQTVIINDTEAPGEPSNLSVTNITDNGFTFHWDSATDNCNTPPAYKVYLNNFFIANTAANTYDFNNLASGTNYTAGVQAIDANNNVSIIVSMDVTTTVGIDNETLPGYSMYPNPARNEVYFTSDIPIKNIQVYDLQGRLILTGAYNNTNRILNTTSLKKGTYFIKLTTKNQKTMTDKLIIK